MPAEPIWLFDLDNTLHNASPQIFPHINRAMTAYVQTHLHLDEADANRLRNEYWKRYGATLLGLVRHHGIDPHHFLAETHRFPALHRMVVFEPALRTHLRRLTGRKILFSNGPVGYVHAVLRSIGLHREFDDVFGIERLGLQPKPQIAAFRRLLAELRVQPERCILVEDSAENLRTAKRLGMRTVWVSKSLRRPGWVDLQLPDILSIGRAGQAFRRD